MPPKVREAVRERSADVCEVCGAARAVLLHHKLRRSQGGSHSADNLLHLCDWCHADIHANPAVSYVRGWLIRSGAA